VNGRGANDGRHDKLVPAVKRLDEKSLVLDVIAIRVWGFREKENRYAA
jgi:hypothetical protein